MDTTENLSARVLLNHILGTETPRTPITRSASKALTSSRITRSRKDAGAHTPQDILRRSLKNKMRESVTRKSLPAIRRGRTNTPAPAPMQFDDGDTPRHILKNILLTEPVKSPVVHDTAASEEPHLPSTSSSITRKRPSTELSGLDLPDLTISNAASTAKGLRRKRPRRSLNATAFEKHLKDGEDGEAQHEESSVELSSLALSSSTSLNLKTPFVDVHTEKGVLKRRVSNRRKISEEAFGAAVNRRIGESSIMPVERGLSETAYTEGFTLGLSKLDEPDITTKESRVEQSSLSLSSSMSLNLKTPFVDVHTEKGVLKRRVSNRRKISEEAFGAAANRGIGESSIMPVERGLSETAYTEGFTLGLSKLSEPDITTNIVNCNTTLYTQSTQDKTTVMATQIQRQLTEMEEEKSKDGKETLVYAFPTEEVIVEEYESQEWILRLEKDDVAEPQKDDGGRRTDDHLKDTAATSESEGGVLDTQSNGSHHLSKFEEVENMLKDQREQTEEDPETVSHSDKEEHVADSQIQGGDATDSQTEEDNSEVSFHSKEDNAAVSDSEEEESMPECQTEEDDAAKSQTGESGTADFQKVAKTMSQSEEEGDVAESQTEEERDGDEEEEKDGEHMSEQVESRLEHTSRRAYRSEGTSIIASVRGKLADGTEMRSQDICEPQTEMPDLADFTHGPKDATYTVSESDTSKQEVMQDNNDPIPKSDASSVEADVQEEEWEDEEEFPCKTPAFVREKRNFFPTEPMPKHSLKKSGTDEASTAAKPKKMGQKKGPAKKEQGLPKSYLMGVFKHFAKTKVSSDVYPVLKQTMDKFFDRVAEDLETYAHHARRNTIEFEDTVLLLKRQGYVNDKVPVEALIEKYLRLDQRKLLIPIATSGNVVIPKKR